MLVAHELTHTYSTLTRGRSWSVEKFFHEDGYMAEGQVREEVERLLADFEEERQGGSKKTK